ncbi:hypothetical protein Cgig2_010019 [Carnegiea gigantea]|uniref:Uncharacterized protein n=1 Tax=Carnegiea gigantea TaxID=171969 RepID=A0A9Q1JQJ3_9CARY|nr:hypothetical protein Cgig2_010019 [Carnegiea gigantea]
MLYKHSRKATTENSNQEKFMLAMRSASSDQQLVHCRVWSFGSNKKFLVSWGRNELGEILLVLENREINYFKDCCDSGDMSCGGFCSWSNLHETDTSCFNIFPPPRHCSNDLVPYHANPHFRIPHQTYWDRTCSPDINVKSEINVLYDQGRRIEESNQVTANMVNPSKICWVLRILEEINLSICQNLEAFETW